MKKITIFEVGLLSTGTLMLSIMIGIILYCGTKFGHLPMYALDPDPYSSGLMSLSRIFFWIYFFTYILLFIQVVYLIVKILVKRQFNKVLLNEISATIVFLLFFEYSSLHYFRAWIFD